MTIDERQYLQDRIEELERKNMSLEKHTYAAPHVWNLVAKILRENYPRYVSDRRMPAVDYTGNQKPIIEIALAFAKRFQEDEGFDPIKWLDQCSPNTDLYPFSELWEEDDV